MTINITADSLHDAASQLGLGTGTAPIKIKWRTNAEYSDYGRNHEQGCIVDAVGCAGEEVQRSFKTSGEALRYIGSILRKHDAYAKKERIEREKRNKLKEKKSCS